MQTDSKTGPRPGALVPPQAPLQAQAQDPPARKEGEVRLVEVNGRKVKVKTVARPAALPRPDVPRARPPAAIQHVPQTSSCAPALGTRQVEVPSMGQAAIDDLVLRHLDQQAKGTALGSFTEALLDVASFHDKRAGMMLSFNPEASVATWPPTPGFMGRVFSHVLQAGQASDTKGMASVGGGMAERLLHELLQALLVPASRLRVVEQLRSVAPDHPQHEQAVAALDKVFTDFGRYELPQAVDSTVHALLQKTRGTPGQAAVDRALVAMLATATQRLTPGSFKRLVLAVQAGMTGEPLGDAAPAKQAPARAGE